MQAVETKGAIQEVCGGFARAADTAELDHLFGNDIVLVAGCDDLAGNGVVSAALAECAGIPR